MSCQPHNADMSANHSHDSGQEQRVSGIPPAQPASANSANTGPYLLDDKGFPLQLALSGASDARAWQRRITREPELDPKNDSTIDTVVANEDNYSSRMVQAVF